MTNDTRPASDVPVIHTDAAISFMLSEIQIEIQIGPTSDDVTKPQVQEY